MATSVSPSSTLEEARAKANLTYEELWFAYFELGGLSSPMDLEKYLEGAGSLAPHDYDLVAHALNELRASLGLYEPVGYEFECTEQPPTVTAVIPTLNEADNLPQVLAKLPPEVTEVVIVDGRSTDETVSVARRCRPDAKIVHQDGRGKGNALDCGFQVATGDITVMLDADGSTDPAEIPAFVRALVDGNDFAKGTRFTSGAGSEDITPLRRLGNWVLTTLVNRIWKVSFSDLCYGYNAFWTRSPAARFASHCRGFEVETLMNIRAAAYGLKIVEIPSFECCRASGVSNLKVGRDGLRVIRTILAEWVRPS